jgi:small subunit ribosomal protein S16
MVKIRLRRVGAKKQPHYRVVVTDSRAPRDGRFVETIGHYNPRTEPPTIEIDAERALYWLSVGAQPSAAVHRMLDKMGIISQVAAVRTGEVTAEELAAEIRAAAAEEAEAKAEEAAPEAEIEAVETEALTPEAEAEAPEAEAEAPEAEAEAPEAEAETIEAEEVPEEGANEPAGEIESEPGDAEATTPETEADLEADETDDVDED